MPATSIAVVGVFPLLMSPPEHTSAAGRRVMVFALKRIVNILAIVLYNMLEEVIYWLFVSGRCKRYRQELQGGSRPGVLP
jgi:hypothetical protein